MVAIQIPVAYQRTQWISVPREISIPRPMIEKRLITKTVPKTIHVEETFTKMVPKVIQEEVTFTKSVPKVIQTEEQYEVEVGMTELQSYLVEADADGSGKRLQLYCNMERRSVDCVVIVLSEQTDHLTCKKCLSCTGTLSYGEWERANASKGYGAAQMRQMFVSLRLSCCVECCVVACRSIWQYVEHHSVCCTSALSSWTMLSMMHAQRKLQSP